MKDELLIISPIAAWIIAQIIKSIIAWIQTGKFDVLRLIGDGGMPSAHSATVCALACSSALVYGLISFQFALSGVLAAIVMHDASGIRLESGKQAQAINEIREYLNSLTFETVHAHLEELLGHTPFQVLIGALTGILVSFITFSILG